MKRLRHWLFNFAAAVSVVMCLATVTYGVRSYWGDDLVGYTGENHAFSAQSTSASIAFIHARWVTGDKRNTNFGQPGFSLMHFPPGGTMNGWNFRIRLRQTLNTGAASFAVRDVVIIPDWFIGVLSALPPGYLTLRIARERRIARAGLCQSCGYDLRATLDRCPECGTIPPAAKGAAT